MAEVALYIATSLDGYIATKSGGIEWLSIVESGEADYGYADFYRSVDALVMGRKTYELALGFRDWPYPGKPSYVFSRRQLKSDRSDVFFTGAEPEKVVAEIAARGAKKIWLVGGSELTAAFLKGGFIDEFIISVVPVILGDGIPLFRYAESTRRLNLCDVQRYPTGLVQLRYITVRM